MQVTWILPDGSQRTAEVAAGTTLKDAALAIGVPRILGECGGCMSCATCHVYVQSDWFARTGGPGEFEDEIIDVAEAERSETSRLSCQTTMTPELDGLVLIVPDPG